MVEQNMAKSWTEYLADLDDPTSKGIKPFQGPCDSANPSGQTLIQKTLLRTATMMRSPVQNMKMTQMEPGSIMKLLGTFSMECTDVRSAYKG